MSVIFDIKPDLTNLVEVLNPYERALESFAEDVKLKGKQIGTANSENPSLLAYYDERKIELKSIMDFVEMHMDKVKGELWQKYTEVHSRELNAKDKEMYIKKDPEYLKRYQLYLCVQELYGRYSSAVEAFVNRGFSLRNITNLRVAQVENGTI